jgi:hypothetical protein
MAETKTVNLEVNSNLNETTKAVTSLKSELRKAQAEVATLSDKFGATSKEAIEAAKRAADLKDKIGDAKNLTDAFNPDAKFKALAGSANIAAGALSGFEGAMALVGVQSEEAQQAILKVQGALALSQGISALQEIPDTFRNIKAVAIDAFKGIKAAIGSTGIGLLVIALGTIVTYWDDIKEAVSGVSDEQKKINNTLNANALKAKEQLDTLDAQDETLKRQGKTEREILVIKQKQTQEVINAQIEAIKNNALIREQQEKAAAKNKEILKGMLDFIAHPIVALLSSVDAIGEKFGKTFGLAEKFKESTVNLIFDPEKTRKEGEAAAKEEQKALTELINKRDGYVNQIKNIDIQKAKDAELTEEEKKKKLEELNKKYNENISKQNDEFDLSDLQKKQDEINSDVKFKEDELAREEQHQLNIAQIQYDSETERNARAEEARQRDLEAFQAKYDAYSSIAQSGENLLASLQATGLARGKAGQTAMKALALVQIGADSAVAFSKMMQGTEISAAGAATSVPPPAAPATYLATKIAFYASGSATILANLARAKALLSGGGSAGGSVGSTPSVGTSGGAAPQFNVVGNAGVNQIAETMNRQSQNPIQAYVVAQNVTTAQSLNRNIVSNASLG